MPLVAPNLDDRTFEQIVTEVRRRIPTFTPRWTDLNESDPGITLAQLFAFMTEHLLFQVNQVPDKGLVTFLKMVGAELHGATPAVADITFRPLNVGAGPLTFDLDIGTRIETSGPPPGEKTALAFETERTFTVLNGSLVDVVSCDCNLDHVSHATANESPTATFAPLGDANSTSDSMSLVFELGVINALWPEGTFRLRFNRAQSTDVGVPPVRPPDPDAQPRIEWRYATGSTPNLDGTASLTFSTLQTAESTNELTRSGYVELVFDQASAAAFIRAPQNVDVPAFAGKFVVEARVLRPDAYQNLGAPRLGSIRLNTVDARALQTVEGEALGGSTGLPGQRFTLGKSPVAPGSGVLIVDERSEGGAIDAVWTETQDLFAAGPDDRVFQLIPATGEILVGNGVYGKIPPPDDGAVAGGNLTMERYQFGGGFNTNVGAATLTNVIVKQSSLPAFDSNNVLPAAGGADEESVARGVARAPAVVRSRYRAVSVGDFEALAMETPEVRVARAFVLPNTRPDCDPGTSPGSVTLVLVPHAPLSTSIQTPIPLQPHVAAAVLRYLEPRRLVTTELHARGASFRTITADVDLQVAPRASVSGTRVAAVEALHRYFHALVGGDDELGWPFGGTVFFSRVFERLLAVPGVARVDELRLGLDDEDPIACEDLPIRPGELLVSGAHIVRARASA